MLFELVALAVFLLVLSQPAQKCSPFAGCLRLTQLTYRKLSYTGFRLNPESCQMVAAFLSQVESDYGERITSIFLRVWLISLVGVKGNLSLLDLCFQFFQCAKKQMEGK